MKKEYEGKRESDRERERASSSRYPMVQDLFVYTYVQSEPKEEMDPSSFSALFYISP